MIEGNISMVPTKQDAFERIRHHQPKLKALGVARLGLFGSFVRHGQQDDSDVDVLVVFEPGQKTFDNFMNTAFLLEEIMGREVDLVTKEGLSSYIGPRILEEVEYVPFDD